MDPVKVFLLSAVLLAMLGRTLQAGLGEACDQSTTCTGAFVCDPATSTCKVKADGTATDCSSSNANCPANAACSTTTCSCNDGYKESSDLCIVLGATCSSTIACGDTDKYVCDTDTCKVKANAAATSCSGNDDCPTNAECDTDANTCSCSSTYKEKAGLCIAVIGSTCTTASECSTALAHTTCQIMSPCAKGMCQCDTGYSGTDCLTLGYEMECSTGSADKCDTSKGLECSSASPHKCVCSTDGHAYKTDFATCTDKKAFGETCTTVANCYIGSDNNGHCPDGGGTCTCATNYKADYTDLSSGSGTKSCRKLRIGESCTATANCGKIGLSNVLSGESSEASPTCDSTCQCATDSAKEYSSQFGSICNSFCLTNLATGTEADAGTTCTSFNQCKSHVCLKCPDDENGKCYDAPCSNTGEKLNINGISLLSVIALLSVFF